MKRREVLAVFNRGLISRLALARGDVERVSLSAEVQKNWMPRRLGPMMLRPGTVYRGQVGAGVYIPFINAVDDCALVDVRTNGVRFFDQGTDLITTPVFSTAITNPLFTSSLTGWTDNDEGAATSYWTEVAGDGLMALFGTGNAEARRTQAVTPNPANVEHRLRIVVSRGPALLRIGTQPGYDDIFRQAVLREGWHSIAFTPTGTFYVQLAARDRYPVYITRCEFEDPGTLFLPSPWLTEDELKKLRWHQSNDVIYLASGDRPQYVLERRNNQSWSLVRYIPEDGPFDYENISPITLTPSGQIGEITVTASSPTFVEGHIGSVWRWDSLGQVVTANLSGDGQFTDTIRVTGRDSQRLFFYSIGGTWTGTLSLQRSLSDSGPWNTIATQTANGAFAQEDGDAYNDVTAYFRVGFESGNYGSGSADVAIDYSSGSISGAFRVRNYLSPTEVSAYVLKSLGGVEASSTWFEPAWSDELGWPEAVAVWEGRAWWSGNGRVWASISDNLTGFNPDQDGDSGPINRLVGGGSAARINWLLPITGLIAGTARSEQTLRSTSFDEPITPSNYNAKASTTKGSAPIPPADADGRGYFVGRSRRSIYELDYDATKYAYSVLDMTTLVPEIGGAGFTRVAIQTEPDVRLHCLREDGTVAMMVRDTAENVICWFELETDGEIVDVAVLPGEIEDRVFYRVKRTINGATVYYHEQLARMDQCVGGVLNYQADSLVAGSGAVTGLGHLEGKEVVVWADGKDQGKFTVTGGAIGETFTNWIAGLGYSAPYKSAKLAGNSGLGFSLGQISRINKIGLLLADTHANGLLFGPDFDTMDALPQVENGEDVDPDRVWDAYDEGMIEFPGDWDTDNRICLLAEAPRPCTVLAAVFNIDRHDHE